MASLESNSDVNAIQRRCVKTTYVSLTESLLGDIVHTSKPSSKRAADILIALHEESTSRPVTLSVLKNTKIGVALRKTIAACKRHKETSDVTDDWDEPVTTAQALLSRFKEIAENERRKKKNATVNGAISDKSNGENAVRGEAASKVLKKECSGTHEKEKPEPAMVSKERGSSESKKKATNSKNTDSVGSMKQDGTDEATVPDHSMSGKKSDIIDCDKHGKEHGTEDEAGANEELLSNFFRSPPTTPIRHISSGDDNASPTSPPTTPLYKVSQRVYARDDATGLLYPAFIRKIVWAPKDDKVNLGFCSPLVNGKPAGTILEKNQRALERADEANDDDEDVRRWDPERNGHHYYVHYLGWNVNWDRWVEEPFLYENSASTEALKKKLAKGYNKVKPKKRGQKMSSEEISNWMKQMVELEAEHYRLVKEEEMGMQENSETHDVSNVANVQASKDQAVTNLLPSETVKNNVTSISITEASVDTPLEKIESNKKIKPTRKLKPENLQKQAQLHKSGLRMKRKRFISDQLILPFNLKKILVEEWEVIAQCNMVHKLPSQVTVRDALNKYLENKLAPLREKQESNSNGNEAKTDVGGSNEMEMDAPPNRKKIKESPSVIGKEWIDMVEGIALFFEQALHSGNLLLAEERSQYKYMRRQILAQKRSFAASPSSVANGSSEAAVKVITSVENNFPLACEHQPSPIPATTCNVSTITASEASVSSSDLKSPPLKLLPERMSEIYGCEHLLRLFVRLPAVVADTPTISELQSRQIFSKLGDLVRFLQKHQSQLFCSSFRRPLPGESLGGGKRRRGGGIATRDDDGKKNDRKKKNRKKSSSEKDGDIEKDDKRISELKATAAAGFPSNIETNKADGASNEDCCDKQ